MPRFYKKISKEMFLKHVEHEFDMNYPPANGTDIDKDLSKVEFDWENSTDFDDTIGFGKYPIGYKELPDGLHVFYAQAGGDWEYPVCFIYYWDGRKIRAYIPKDGNVYNKKTKVAYGNGDEDDLPKGFDDSLEEPMDYWEKEFDLTLMESDIIGRIKLKP